MLKMKVFLEKKLRLIALEDSKLSALKCNSGASFLLPCGCRKMLLCLSKPFGNSFVTPSLHNLTVVHSKFLLPLILFESSLVLFKGSYISIFAYLSDPFLLAHNFLREPDSNPPNSMRILFGIWV